MLSEVLQTLQNVEGNMSSGNWRWVGGERQRRDWNKRRLECTDLMWAGILMDEADRFVVSTIAKPKKGNEAEAPKKKWWKF